MASSIQKFSLKQTIKNIARFVDEERYYTDVEEHFGIPWRMSFEKVNGLVGFWLQCEKEECEDRKWTVEIAFTMRLVSRNGKFSMQIGHYTFESPQRAGWSKVMRWEELESDFAVDDSVNLEAQVRIVKTSDVPCLENMGQKIVKLTNNVKHISSIDELEFYVTKPEIQYNMSWGLQLIRNDEFLGIYLRCDTALTDKKSGTIQAEFVIKLVSPNGPSLSLYLNCNLNVSKRAAGAGFGNFIRWADMEEKYAVNNTLTIETRVKLVKMIGFDNEHDDLEDKFFDCASLEETSSESPTYSRLQ